MLCSGVVEVIDDTPLEVECNEVVTVNISSNGFPALLFPTSVIKTINDNCTRQTDFNVSPLFYFCPDGNASFTLTLRGSREVLCTGRVIVTGNPSPFGNCASNGLDTETLSSNNRKDFNSMQKGTMELFPNPINGQSIQMRLPSNTERQLVTYQVINLIGQQQATGQLEYNYGTLQVPLDNLPSGTYIMVARLANGERFTERFVKAVR